MIPLTENVKRYFSLKEIAIILGTIIIAVSVGIGVFVSLKHDVVISYNGEEIKSRTMRTTVQGVLEQNNIKVGSDDFISVALDEKLEQVEGNIIEIKTAVPVNVVHKGEKKIFMTYRDTVKEALDNGPFELGESYRLEGVSSEDQITKDMEIKIVEITKETISEEVSIPCNVINKKNASLEKGAQKVLVEGEDGVSHRVYEVVYEDGKEVSRTLVSEDVLSNPTDKIVALGTAESAPAAVSRGDLSRYTGVHTMSSTGYSAYDSGNSGTGRTATGAIARRGIAAVDPNVIPLGTKLYIEGYGYAVAADTGGAIRGNKIDLCFDNRSEALAWGRRQVEVRILEE